MQQQLFPKEVIEFSVENHFDEFSSRSKVIYLTTLLCIVIAIGSLPFIRVNVTVQSSGLIRPSLEKNEIKAPVSGKVKEVQIKDNQPVHKDQTLLYIQTDILDEQLTYNQKRTLEVQQKVNDLERLVRMDSTSLSRPTAALHTSLYQQNYLQFRQQLHEAQHKFSKIKKEYDRDQQLYSEKVIASSELDNKRFEKDMAQSETRLLLEKQISQWQADLAQFRTELTELLNKGKQLEKEKEQYILKAPIDGTIQQFLGINPGSFVYANQVIAEISPDSNLVVECYISPQDIGLLREGTLARFQIDAFNYNEWGLITGRISEISNDINVIQEKPFFKVKCYVDQSFLTLKNGYRGNLKKGMTLRARFHVAERSLFQLLYDKIDDWINPVQEAA